LLWKEKYLTVNEALKENLWPALGWGIVVLILLPIAFLILAFSIIGFPVALILFGFVTLWAYLATIIIGGLLGDFTLLLFNHDAKKYPYLALSIGLVILLILYSVPVIGWIFKLITMLLAFGVILIARKKILGLKF
jgi:hypothetical protein